MDSNQSSQYTSGKKIYTIRIRAVKGYNSFQHMNPYQYLHELNAVIARRGLDIRVLEVRYVLSKSKAQKGFQSSDTNRYDFQVDRSKNNVFKTENEFLNWIFQDSIPLKKPQMVETAKFDNLMEEEKKKEEEKKLQEIDKFLERLMKISDEGKRMKQSYDDMISFEKFKMFDHSMFKEGEYSVYIKAMMSEPLKVKLDQEKQSGKQSFPIIWKNVEIRSFLHPFPGQESADRVQELAEISEFTLGCSAPESKFIDSLRENGKIAQDEDPQLSKFIYYDSSQVQATIQKCHNQAVNIRSFIAVNKQSSQNSDTIKSFQIQTEYFDQSMIKTQVNMGQIKKIEIYNGKEKQGVVEYYFYLAYPPKYFISQLKKEVAATEDYMLNWQRIQNVFFLRNRRIAKNQFLRLYLFNNTILRVKLQANSPSSFAKAYQMLQNIREKFDDKISIPIYVVDKKIKFQWSLRSLQSGFDYQKGFLRSLGKIQDESKVWTLKYFILIMVRYDHLYPSEVLIITKEIDQNPQDIDVYIYVFWKIATDIWGYNDKQRRLIYFLLDQVKSAKSLNRTHMMKKIIKNTELIANVFRMNSAPSGFLYAAPTPQMKGRLLKQFDKESQYFMRVSVVDDHQGTLKNQKYITKGALKSKMLEFTILGRKYIPQGWSPSQLRSYSLWYINQTDKTSSGRRINRQIVLSFLGSFDQIENPAKRAARIGQSFSASWTFDASKIKYKQEPDILTENNFNFTDGIGKISKDLVNSISLELKLTELTVIQIRYLGAKGILVLDEELPKNTVILRPSMIKYRCTNQQALKYLDVLDCNKYKSGFLNRQVIILLKTLKIPDTVFEELQKTHIKNISQMSFKDCSVFKQMNDDLNSEVNNLEPANKTILSLVRAGFQLQTEPFFRGVLQTMKKNGYNQLKQKCNIRVQKSARIIGIIDEFGVLNENEVYCAIYDPFSLKKQSQKLEIIDQPAMITRNPCLDPADIRVVKCIGRTQIAARFQAMGRPNKFQKFLNCVIFPQKGKIPLTAQISGSDLDGDNFFICWDQTLVPKQTDVRKPKTIDNPSNQKKGKSGAEYVVKKQNEMYEEMMNFFFEYINYEKLGQIDNSHLVKADGDETNYADNQDCMKLSEIHGKAVDFPKTGYCPQVDPKLLVSIYPDFMQKQGAQTYTSNSILGRLYRQIKEKIQDLLKDQVYKNDQILDVDLIKNLDAMNFTRDQVYEAMGYLLQYQKSLKNLIKLVGIDTEYEIYSGNFSIAKEKVDQYGKTRLISTILQLKERYFDVFFDGLAQDQNNYSLMKEENLHSEKAFSLEAKRKAALYYVSSYIYKFGDKLRFPAHSEQLEKIRTWVKHCLESHGRIEKEGRFCGFVWFIIPKIIINIKKRAIIEAKKDLGKKDSVKKNEAKQNDDSESQRENSKGNQDQDEENSI